MHEHLTIMTYITTITPLFGNFMFFISCPHLFLLSVLFTIIVMLVIICAKFDFKYFHQQLHLILQSTFSPLLIILAIIWLQFDLKTLNCAEMCIMGNGNDPPDCISSRKFPDENMNSTKYSGLTE